MPQRSSPLEHPAFVSLPREIFCNIVSYLGPTSSSLCTLSQVTREHNAILTSIGDAMLQRARMRFRTPIPPKSYCESSVSLFVRHARASKAVHDSLEVLNGVLQKDGFPTTISSSCLEDTNIPEFISQFKFEQPEALSEMSNLVEPSELKNALNVALCLLGCPKHHYFADAKEAQEIAKNAATTALEWKVSTLCSKLGAKAYKYAESRICRRDQDELFSAYIVTDEMLVDEESHYDEDGEDVMSFDSSLSDADEDVALLDKASLVMQLTFLHE